MMTEDEQTAELADALEALEARYPTINPDLKDELRGLKEKFRAIAAYKQAGDAGRVIGMTHISIREHQDATDSRVAGVQEDMVGMQLEQDASAALIVAATKAIAALVEVHTAKRLNKLEQWKDDIASQVRGIETEVAHLLRAREQGEATAPHTD